MPARIIKTPEGFVAITASTLQFEEALPPVKGKAIQAKDLASAMTALHLTSNVRLLVVKMGDIRFGLYLRNAEPPYFQWRHGQTGEWIYAPIDMLPTHPALAVDTLCYFMNTWAAYDHEADLDAPAATE